MLEQLNPQSRYFFVLAGHAPKGPAMARNFYIVSCKVYFSPVIILLRYSLKLVVTVITEYLQQFQRVNEDTAIMQYTPQYSSVVIYCYKVNA